VELVGHVPRHEAEAVVPQGRVPGERGVLVPGRHVARGGVPGQVLGHVAGHAVLGGEPVERRGEVQAQEISPQYRYLEEEPEEGRGQRALLGSPSDRLVPSGFP